MCVTCDCIKVCLANVALILWMIPAIVGTAGTHLTECYDVQEMRILSEANIFARDITLIFRRYKDLYGRKNEAAVKGRSGLSFHNPGRGHRRGKEGY